MPRAKAARHIRVPVGAFRAANDLPAFFIAGTCILESPGLLERVGRELKKVFARTKTPWILKCSFDKANRSSASSFRGRGMAYALDVFSKVKRDLNVPMITDVHEPAQAEAAAKVVDVLQIPAFLCRQTDLLLAAGRTGRPVNIKKGQFLAPWDIVNAVRKVESTGNKKIMITERGSSFGYGNLVVDMRGLEIMARLGYPVVFDSTHSCQLPGALGSATGGQREFAPILARSAAAVGIAGFSLETHPNPDKALSDGPNSVRLKDVAAMADAVLRIDRLIKGGPRRLR